MTNEKLVSRETVEAVRRLFIAFNERDADAVRELCTADVEWRPAFIGGGIVEGAVYRGREGVSEFVATQDAAWEDVFAEPLAIRDLGDRALIEVHLTAIGRESRIPVDTTTWNLFELRDGKLSFGRVYTVREQALAAAGVEE